MPGLLFEDQAPVPASAPNRMDVALFVGFVPMRPAADIPTRVRRWLDERGWVSAPYGRPLDGLQDLPIPIDDWGQFDALFRWEQRSADRGDGATYLGAAVRSFFAQGGRRCYVVRVGDPWPLETPRIGPGASDGRLAAVAKLIPGYPFGLSPSPADRVSWSGVGHLFGLPDVSFVCLPDLPDAVAADRIRVPLPTPPPGPIEVFVECSDPVPPPPADRTVRGIGAPRCDEEGYRHWAKAIELLTDMIKRYRHETQLVAAVPLSDGRLAFDLAPASAYVHLAYPWTRTPGSGALPEQLESPDAVLVGILARNALSRGTFRSAANLHVADVYDVDPDLDRYQQEQDRLIERVALIGPTPAGLRLLSDVTLSGNESYRPGGVSRLISTIVRTARRLGEEVTFESSGEPLWGEVRGRLNGFMRGLYDAGAFRGDSPEEAYQVRCDRSTMSQNDIDNGRVVAYVQFDAASIIDTITVVLIVNDGAQVSISGREEAA